MNDNEALQALAVQTAEFDVIFGSYYLAKVDGELVLAINTMRKTDQVGESQYRTRQYWTRIYRADGTSEEWMTEEYEKGSKVKQSFPAPYKLEVPQPREAYEAFYAAWAETGADETMRTRRRAVKLQWAAYDAPDFSGGY